MTDLSQAITELKDSAYQQLRIYNQRLVLIFLEAAKLHSSLRWYEVAAKAWPILLSDEAKVGGEHSRRVIDARRKLLDQARGKIMFALSKDLSEAEALLCEAGEIHERSKRLMSSSKFVATAMALKILSGY